MESLFKRAQNGSRAYAGECAAIHNDSGKIFNAVVLADLCGLIHIDIAGIITVFRHCEFLIGGNRGVEAREIAVMDGKILRIGCSIIFIGEFFDLTSAFLRCLDFVPAGKSMA